MSTHNIPRINTKYNNCSFILLFIINYLLLLNTVNCRSCTFQSQPIMYHQLQTQQQCLPCLPQCTNCHSINDITCADGNCQIGYYHNITNNQCNKCMHLCERCQYYQQQLLTITIYKQRCIKCVDGYYYNQIQQACLQCQSGAKICTYSSTLLCLSGYYFQTKSLSCKHCMSNCLQCSQSTTCNKCQQQYITNLTTNICMKCPINNCKQCQYNTMTTFLCTSCKTGYQLYSNSLCIKYVCQYQNCIQCESPKGKCTLCQQQYYLYNGLCHYGASLLCLYAENGTDYGRCISCIQGVSNNVENALGYCVIDLAGQSLWNVKNINIQQQQQNIMNLRQYYHPFTQLNLCITPYLTSTHFQPQIVYTKQLPACYLIRIKTIFLYQNQQSLSQNIQLSLNISHIKLWQQQFISSKQLYCQQKNDDYKSVDINIGKIQGEYRVGIYPQYQQLSTIGEQTIIKFTYNISNNSRISIKQIYLQLLLCMTQHCSRCLSQYSCIQCNKQYYLQQYQCVQQCSIGYNTNQYLRTCTFACQDGYYLDIMLNRCLKCRVQCLRCLGYDVCLQCNNNGNGNGNYYYLDQNRCVLQCDNGVLLQSNDSSIYGEQNSGRCQKCMNPCRTCQQYKVIQNNTIHNNTIQQQQLIRCTSCSIGYYYNHTCVLDCPSGYFPSLSSTSQLICQSCQYPCQTCSQNTNKCQECANEYYLLLISSSQEQQYIINMNNMSNMNNSNTLCLQQCPQQYHKTINYNTIKICQKCTNPCKQCINTADNCVSCRYGYLLLLIPTVQQQQSYNNNNNICVNQCPIGYYIDYITTGISQQQQSMGTCMRCSDINCNKCIKQDYMDTDICLQCNNNNNTNNNTIQLLLQNGICVQQCRNGWSSNGICQSCIYPCMKCTSNQHCFMCDQDYYLYNNTNDNNNDNNDTLQCLLLCPDGYHKLTIQANPNYQQSSINIRRCQACKQQCLTCITYQLCTSCSLNYIYDQINNQCIYDDQGVDECSDGTYQLLILSQEQQNNNNNNNSSSKIICKTCSQQCLTCQDTAYFCLSCSTVDISGNSNVIIYLLQQLGKCMQNCPVTHLPNSITKICQKCNQNCLSCSQSLNNCTQCPYNYYLFHQQQPITTNNNNICLIYQQCQLIYSYYPNLQTMQCQQCIHPCLDCSALFICQLCAQGWYLFNGRCVASCLMGYYSQSIPIIDSQYYNHNNNNIDITNIQVYSTCQQCYTNCQQCQSLLQCTACTQNYYLHQYNVPQIIQYIHNSNNTTTIIDNSATNNMLLFCMENCPQLYYPDHQSRKCKVCKPPCLSCTDLLVCSSCIQGYVYHYGRCLKQCPSRYYHNTNNNTNQCSICPIGCQSCLINQTSQQLTCSQCIHQYYYFQLNSTCLQSCPQYYHPNIYQRTCIKCQPPCLQCTQQYICTSCIDGYAYMQGSCYGNCPIGTYIQSSSLTVENSIAINITIIQCIRCPQLCLQCNNNYHCSICTYNSNLLTINSIQQYQQISSVIMNINNNSIQGQQQIQICIQQCPQSYFKSPSAKYCHKCTNNCQKCQRQRTNCLLCKSGWYLQRDTCVKVCSQGFYSQIGSNICVKCLDGCQKCDSMGCYKCYDSYLVNQLQLQQQFSNKRGYCSYQCPIGTYKNTQHLQCSTCQQGCLSCLSLQICTKCSQQYILLDITCIFTNKCPSNLYYDTFNNQCIKQCDTSIQYIYQTQTQKRCYPIYNGCPNNLIVRNKQCVQKCGIDQHKINNGGIIQCQQGISNNDYQISVINKYDRIILMITFTQIMRIQQEQGQYFNDITIQTKMNNNDNNNNNRRRLIEQYKQLPISYQQTITSSPNIILYQISIISDTQQQSQQQQSIIYPQLLVTVRLKSLQYILSASSTPLQNNKQQLTIYNTILQSSSNNNNNTSNIKILSIIMLVIGILIIIGLLYRSYYQHKILLFTAYMYFDYINIYEITAFFNLKYSRVLSEYLRYYSLTWNIYRQSIQDKKEPVLVSPEMFYVNGNDVSLGNVLIGFIIIGLTAMVMLVIWGLKKHYRNKNILENNNNNKNNNNNNKNNNNNNNNQNNNNNNQNNNNNINNIHNINYSSIYLPILSIFIPPILLFSLGNIWIIFPSQQLTTKTNLSNYIAQYPLYTISSLIISFILVTLILIGLIYIISKQIKHSTYLDPQIIPNKKLVIRLLPLYFFIRKILLVLLSIVYSNNGLYCIIFGVISTVFLLTIIAWYQPYSKKIRYINVVISQSMLLGYFMLLFIYGFYLQQYYREITIVIIIWSILMLLVTSVFPILTMIDKDNHRNDCIVIDSKSSIGVKQQQQLSQQTVVSSNNNNNNQNIKKNIYKLQQNNSQQQQNGYQNSPNCLLNKQLVNADQIQQLPINDGNQSLSLNIARQADCSNISSSQSDQLQSSQNKRKRNNNNTNTNNNETGRLGRRVITTQYRQFKHYDLDEYRHDQSNQNQNQQGSKQLNTRQNINNNNINNNNLNNGKVTTNKKQKNHNDNKNHKFIDQQLIKRQRQLKKFIIQRRQQRNNNYSNKDDGLIMASSKQVKFMEDLHQRNKNQ